MNVLTPNINIRQPLDYYSESRFEDITKRLLHYRDKDGYIIIDGYFFDNEELLLAYKLFVKDYICQDSYYLKNLNEIRLWN